MKFLRYVLPAIATVCSIATTVVGESNELDEQALSDFIDTKRDMTLDEKSANLTFSGDISFEYKAKSEKDNGMKVIGSGSGSNYAANEYDVEFNLRTDYRTDETWAVAHLRFDNNMGPLGTTSAGSTVPGNSTVMGASGTANRLELRRAYFGWNLFEDGDSAVKVEIGRKLFLDSFDSRVQFYGFFDGVLLSYNMNFEQMFDFYVTAGVNLINERFSHFGYVAEFGFLNIVDLGLNFKYSYNTIEKNGNTATTLPQSAAGYAMNNREFDFEISQFTLSYDFDPEMLGMDAKVYGAWLMNHKAKKGFYNYTRSALAGAGKADEAWYIGFTLGKLEKAGDWSVDLNYQRVEANAIHTAMVSGIGATSRAADATRSDAGNLNKANYKGWELTLFYNLTDNISVMAQYEDVSEVDKVFNGTGQYSRDFTEFELELTYAF